MMDLSHVSKEDPGSSISDTLMYLQAFGDPGQAFCNSILFCLLDRTVRDYIVDLCCRRNQRYDRSNQERERLIAADENDQSNEHIQHASPRRHTSRTPARRFTDSVEHSVRYKSVTSDKLSSACLV